MRLSDIDGWVRANDVLNPLILIDFQATILYTVASPRLVVVLEWELMITHLLGLGGEFTWDSTPAAYRV